MAILITCSNLHCGKTFKVKGEPKGPTIMCPACGQMTPLKGSPQGSKPDRPAISTLPPPYVPPQLTASAPRVKKLGASPAMRFAAGLVVLLAIASVAGFLYLHVMKRQKTAAVTIPPPVPAQAAPQAAQVQAPPAAPAPPPKPAPVQAAAPKPAAPPPKVVFDPLRYAADIAPVNKLIDHFQYDLAIEKTRGLAAAYQTTPEGRLLIKQKALNIEAIKRLRAGALERVNGGLKVSMKEVTQRLDGEAVGADEQKIAASQAGAKTEIPWASLSKIEIFAFYAKSGAENDPPSCAALACFLMEGAYKPGLFEKAGDMLSAAERGGFNIHDLGQYLQLLKMIQAAVDKSWAAAPTIGPPGSQPQPPKEEAAVRPEPPKTPQGTIRVAPSSRNMVPVPAGEFTMGDESISDARPKHKVYLDAFLIDKYEVTNAEYLKFCEATSWTRPRHWRGGQIPVGRENHPVVNVCWSDAQNYAHWACARLPTEAEWEKAARGAGGRSYPWGNSWDPNLCNAADRLATVGFNVGAGSASAWAKEWKRWSASKSAQAIVDEGGYTLPVGSFPKGASSYGCMDMAGNVAEWCLDGYDAGYYKVSSDRNPTGPEDAMLRCTRGGSWICHPKAVQCGYRGMASATEANVYIGFRCVKNAQ